MPNEHINRVDVYKNNTLQTLINISDTTAVAADVAQGKYFYLATGEKVAGTSSGGGGTGGITQDANGYLVLSDQGGDGGVGAAWLGSGAEKVGTIISRTINLQDDTGYDSWTASTTATTLIAADTDPYYSTTLDMSSYDYCVVTKGFIEPVYLSGTPMTYTTKRVCQYHVWYTYGYPDANTIASVQTETAGATTTNTSSTSLYIQYYYNGSGAVDSRSATQCGPLYMVSYPTFSITASSGSFTYKFPAFNAKCDGSRFTTTRKGQVDSANTNYVVTVDLYRVPHGNGLMSHWVSEMCADLNA